MQKAKGEPVTVIKLTVQRTEFKEEDKENHKGNKEIKSMRDSAS